MSPNPTSKWITVFLLIMTSSDVYVSGCDTFHCECAAIGGVYVNETQSCLFVPPGKGNWWKSFKSCQTTAANNFTSTSVVGRLAHVDSDHTVQTIRQNFGTHDSLYIGMRSEDSGQATNLTDYFWWLQLSNHNAKKRVSDLENVTSKSLSNRTKNCVIFDVTANQWKDVHCADMNDALCEILADQCNMTNPCVPPKVCVPDSNNQVKCFCPSGTFNDTNCGIDCTGKPDGDYPIGDCSQHYYTCSSESTTRRECPPNDVFDPFHGVCSATALACKCEQLGYRYVPSTQSCVAAIDKPFAWLGAFNMCKDKTAAFEGINGLIGRSVHNTNQEMNSALFDIGNNLKYYNGMRNSPDHFDNSASLEHFSWYLDPNNNNALLPVTQSDHITSMSFSPGRDDCVVHLTSNENSWTDRFCGLGARPMCQIFYNQCEYADPCPAPKQCVPDANGQALCFCPNNAANMSDCTDCSGKPDGNYYLGTCVKHYYACSSSISTLYECASGEVFDPHTNACSNTSLECKCVQNEGHYFLSTHTCLVTKVQNGNWYKHFKDCSDDIANSFEIDHLYGRLAHVKTADVAAKAIDLANQNSIHMGARALPDVTPAGSSSGLANFHWWLDKDNPNAVNMMEELDYLFKSKLDGLYDDCIEYETDRNNRWLDKRCSEFAGRSPMCEIFHNQCKVSDPCLAPKVCVPDLQDQARCFCPTGAPNTTDCTDCSDKIDGIYAVAICNQFYYTCASGVSTLHQCPFGSVFDRFISNCTTNVTLECKCQELGGAYLPQRMACIRKMPSLMDWSHSFDYCKAKVSEFGPIPSLIGRLAHEDSKDVSIALVNLHNNDNRNKVWIGARAVQNGSEMGDFHWWFDRNNSNAVKLLQRPAYIASIDMDSNIEQCGIHCVDSDQWKHMDCLSATHRRAACEFLQNQCDISNPCEPPKVCYPDINLETHCFCPAGAVNDATCGSKCSGKPDGNYSKANCSKDYYSCSAGLSALHECGPNELFDQNSQICSSNILGCNQTEMIGANCTDVCACGPEMSDKNCSVTDLCYFEPCKNGGQCTSTGNQTYTCNCSSEFLLPNCSERTPTCPKDTVERCNGPLCHCKANQRSKSIDYIGIGHHVRAFEGITVLLEENSPTSIQCAMACGSVSGCTFFSYRETTGECMLHSSISPGITDTGFEMFAKIIV